MSLTAEDHDELVAGQDYGPAMQALDERRRRFVNNLLDQRGTPNYAAAARAAGYSDVKEGAKVAAFHLVRNPRIIAALHEESRRRFTILGWRGVLGMAAIAQNPEHPDHFRALKELADRFGYAAVSEQRITVDHTDRTGAAMVERIKALAAELGVDAGKLLGVNAAEQPMKLIEGKVEDVERQKAVDYSAERGSTAKAADRGQEPERRVLDRDRGGGAD